jgi:LIM-domain binding protein
MSLILDGAIESQEGQAYTVFCAKARWPMYYDNGYIMELNGVLRARCKTVPVNLSVLGTGIPAGAPGSTPRISSAVPAGNTNGMGSSPSSSNNMQGSPTTKPSNTGNLSYGSETKPYIPMQNAPYMVKIDELSFDSESVEKFIDAGHHPLKEPENVYGVPMLTMRMLEFCEGSQALEPLIDFVSAVQTSGPLRMYSF